MSWVAAMIGSLDKANGFSALRVSVNGDNLYLLAGWMRKTGDSKGYLGGVWEKDKTELQYWKIADWSSRAYWRLYAAVLGPPQEADNFRFMALQRGIGMILFDNMLFCQIHPSDFDNVGN